MGSTCSCTSVASIRSCASGEHACRSCVRGRPTQLPPHLLARAPIVSHPTRPSSRLSQAAHLLPQLPQDVPRERRHRDPRAHVAHAARRRRPRGPPAVAPASLVPRPPGAVRGGQLGRERAEERAGSLRREARVRAGALLVLERGAHPGGLALHPAQGANQPRLEVSRTGPRVGRRSYPQLPAAHRHDAYGRTHLRGGCCD